MKEDQERVRALLTDTITLLCTNGLSFQRKLRVQGLLGITIDDDEVFIVDIHETLSGGSTVDSAPPTNLSTAVTTMEAQTQISAGQSSPRKIVTETSDTSAYLCHLPSLSKNDMDDCIGDEALPSIVDVKEEPVDPIIVVEPFVRPVRREQHFRKHIRKSFDKRHKVGDYASGRRDRYELSTNRLRRLSSLNSEDRLQSDFVNSDNNFDEIVPSDNECDVGYPNGGDSFSSPRIASAAGFTNNSNVYLIDGSSDWDFPAGRDNPCNKNLTDFSMEQVSNQQVNILHTD